MTSPPPLFPRTIFLTGSNQPPKSKQDSAVGSDSQGPAVIENCQTSHINRSQLRVSKKPLPPLPGAASRSGIVLDNPDLPVSPDKAVEADKDTEVTNTKRSQSLYWKPLPLPPTCTSQPEHIYEETDFTANSQHTQEDAKAFIRARQPPPVPPKPLHPLQLPIIGPCVALDTQEGSHAEGAGEETSLKLPKSSRDSFPRSTKPAYLPECGHIPVYLDILPDNVRNTTLQDGGSSSGPFHKPLPPLPRKTPSTLSRITQGSQDAHDTEKSEETDELAEWWSSVTPWATLSLEHRTGKEDETEIFHMKVNRIQRGIDFFLCLMKKHDGAFRAHITQLNHIADKFDKSSKSLKVRAITGGTTGALGGVATVTGIVLAPLTMGASLVVTAVGVGAIAAGSVTGASAAILNKKQNGTGRKSVEKKVDEYRAEVKDIDQSLEFVVMGVSELEKHDVSRLMCDGDFPVVPIAVCNVSSIQVAARSSGILQGFAQHMDGCVPEEESQKSKKDSSNKYSTSIRELAQQLQCSLDDLSRLREMFSTAKL